MTKKKACSRCGKKKPLTAGYFYGNTANVTGFFPHCIECTKGKHPAKNPYKRTDITPSVVKLVSKKISVRDRRILKAENEELMEQGLRKCSLCEKTLPYDNEHFRINTYRKESCCRNCANIKRKLLYDKNKKPQQEQSKRYVKKMVERHQKDY